MSPFWRGVGTVLGALVLATHLSACDSADPVATCERDGIALESGLRYTDLRCGEGKIAARGHSATVRYTGELPDGLEFDSSIERGGSFEFRLGVGQAILGWDEGLVGMQVGGIRRLVIPPELAYGDAGFPPHVPPDSPVIYEVELLELREPEL